MKTMADEMHENALQAQSTKEAKNQALQEIQFENLLSRIRGLASVGSFNLKAYDENRFNNSAPFKCIESNRTRLEDQGFKVEKKQKRHGFLGLNKEIWYDISW